MLGYQNNVLRVDLSAGKIANEPLNMDFAEKYVGQKGLAIKYLYEELKAGTDALGTDNKLLLTTSPLTGTNVPCSGKLSIAAKSPATGTINDCSIGGHAALKIKYAGYDMVILEGKAAKPSILVIDDEKVEIKDAGSLWGIGSHDAETALIKEYGHEFSVLSIGPAGENLVPMSCINSDYYRQAGRGGIGAVMGSKNIKAILIRGTKGVKVPDAKKMCDRVVEILQADVLQEDNTFIFETGTTAFLEACSDGGILPYKNFSDATDPDWEEYNGDVLLKHLEGKRGCGSCGLGCGNFLKIGDAVCEGPEYESIAVAGPNAGVKDPEKIVKFNQ
ncbi:MAG: aldehyde ferredoxin oxidoreductase N-terminal domain-containing protein, partial [Anaerovoracaceae bacterium]